MSTWISSTKLIIYAKLKIEGYLELPVENDVLYNTTQQNSPFFADEKQQSEFFFESITNNE